jgi:hypothetical protein
VLPDIHSHVKYFSRDHPEQFSLRLSNLIMQTAQDTLAGLGMIILHKIERNASFRELPFLVAFQKKAPFISEHFWFNQQDIGEGGGNKFQNNFLGWIFDDEDN